VSAKINGRNFVGAELNAQYVAIANARLQEELPKNLASDLAGDLAGLRPRPVLRGFVVTSSRPPASVVSPFFFMGPPVEACR